MREWIAKNRRLAAGAGLLLTGLAWASPWDIDMIDGVNFKAYEWKMLPPKPVGSVQRPQGTIVRSGGAGSYQNDWIEQHDKLVDGDQVTNPYGSDPAAVAQGERLFGISCAPCHGPGGAGGGPVATNADPAKPTRFKVGAPKLSGVGTSMAGRSDGFIYLTIRNGGIALGEGRTLMPAYGVSLTDRERWSIVSYIRTLEGAQRPAPVAPAIEGAPE